MTKLSISMAATLLMISLAPAANAYSIDPAEDMLQEISQLGYVADDLAEADGSCQFTVTPELAQILGLQSDWRTGDTTAIASVACNGDH